MNRADARRPRMRRGTAIIEFAIVLPTLMFITLLIIFFGHSLMRKQHVISADRHFAWRQAKALPAPADDPGIPVVREQFFRSEPVNVSLHGGHATPRDAREGLVEATRAKNAAAGIFADTVVWGVFPGDVGYQVQAAYPRDVLPLDQFQKDIADRYYREGLPWQHKHVAIWQELRDQFIQDFDTRMVASGGLAAVVRNLYLRRW